jgi:hypothetical protein
MASRLLSARKHSVAYWPNLTSIVRHFVSFTAEDAAFMAPSALKSVDMATSAAAGMDASKTLVPHYNVETSSMSELLKHEQRFPLPGSIGFASHHQCPVAMAKCEVDLSVLNQFAEICCQTDVKPQPSPVDLLECIAQEIPNAVQKDFSDLFPDRDLGAGDLTVITLSQRTEHDMTSWSTEVETEREELLGNFIAGATDICHALKQAGYWADFIDPSSGRPYFGAYTNATLFETDERYRKFGFDINDLGCCKVISHRLWGSHAYVGSLFTNAPMDHPAISKLAA